MRHWVPILTIAFASWVVAFLITPSADPWSCILAWLLTSALAIAAYRAGCRRGLAQGRDEPPRP
jgi:hypothetical protein